MHLVKVMLVWLVLATASLPVYAIHFDISDKTVVASLVDLPTVPELSAPLWNGCYTDGFYFTRGTSDMAVGVILHENYYSVTPNRRYLYFSPTTNLINMSNYRAHIKTAFTLSAESFEPATLDFPVARVSVAIALPDAVDTSRTRCLQYPLYHCRGGLCAGGGSGPVTPPVICSVSAPAHQDVGVLSPGEHKVHDLQATVTCSITGTGLLKAVGTNKQSDLIFSPATDVTGSIKVQGVRGDVGLRIKTGPGGGDAGVLVDVNAGLLATGGVSSTSIILMFTPD